MKKLKRQHANARVVASAGNTKVKTPNDNDNNSDTTAFIISSSSKAMIRSILSLFNTYDRISTQHNIDTADAISRDIASSHIRVDFEFVKLPKSASTGMHEIAIVDRGTSLKGVTCTSLRDFMESRTTAVSYQRVLHMAEMIYEQMTGLDAHGLAPPYYGLEDILVINESFFCFINDAKLFQIESAENGIGGGGGEGGGGGGSKNKKKHIIHVTRAISRSGAFFAPELIGKINALPYSADVRSSYYSYGLLLAYCATLNSNLIVSHEKGKEEKTGEKEGSEGRKDDDGFGDSDSDGVENEEAEQLSGGKRRRRKYHDNKNQQHQKQQQQKQEQEHQHGKDKKSHNWQVILMRALAPLQYTKLYWLILRCCDPDVSRRSIIYI